MVRQEHGTDIDAACGTIAFKHYETRPSKSSGRKLLVNQKVSKMFQLKTWVDKDGELTPKGRKLSQVFGLCLSPLFSAPMLDTPVRAS